MTDPQEVATEYLVQSFGPIIRSDVTPIFMGADYGSMEVGCIYLHTPKGIIGPMSWGAALRKQKRSFNRKAKELRNERRKTAR